MYLEKSRTNIAVITEYAAMEAYKGDTLASIYKSMEILAKYPSQVIVLKGTRKISALKGIKAGLQGSLIDNESNFSEYANHLRDAKNGNKIIEQQLLDLGKWATEHLDLMLDDALTTGSALADIATMYSKEERKLVRIGENLPFSTIQGITRNILNISATIFNSHPDINFKPSRSELFNTFIFRYALCIYLLALDWAALGGAKDVAPAKLRNDFVDMNFVAYATYFDGLMTADAKVIRLHQEARLWLTSLYKCKLPGGLFGWRSIVG